MAGAVSLCGHLHAVLELLDGIVDLALLEEGEAVGEVQDPRAGVVAGEPSEDLHRLQVVVLCIFGVVEVAEMLVEVGVGDCVWDIVLPHFLLPNLYGPRDVLLEGDSLPHAEQHCRLLLVDGGEDGPAVHVLHLDLGYLLGDLEFFECEVVLELAVEYLHLQ